MSQKIHAVLIVPAYGHGGGLYDRGESAGRFSELDLVDGYVPSLVEELEEELIRYEVMATRERPGIPHAQRSSAVERNRLVLHCAGGHGDAPRAKNTTVITYGSGASRELAEHLAESVSEWGQCFVWGHKTANPVLSKSDPVIAVPETLGVRIEPFMVNGPQVNEYMQRLPQLGICIARSVSGYLKAKGLAKMRGMSIIGA